MIKRIVLQMVCESGKRRENGNNEWGIVEGIGKSNVVVMMIEICE